MRDPKKETKAPPDFSLTSESGIALATALVAAVVVSVLAVVAINLTFRRLELSVFRSDHEVASYSAEAGIRYVFERVRLDTLSDGLVAPPNGFEDDIRFDDDPPYVVSPLAVDTSVSILYNGTATNFDVDEQVPELELGFKNVHVAIEEDPAADPPPPPRRLKVHANADYGTGGP